MKRMKKVLATLLALAMVLGMSLTTFAEGVNITLQNMSEAEKIEYAQLIVADPTADSGWSFVNDDVATAYARGLDLIDDKATITNEKTLGSTAQTALWKLICYKANNTKVGENEDGTPKYKTVTDLPDGMNQTTDAATETQIGKALSNAADKAAFTTIYQADPDAEEPKSVPTTISVSTAGIYAIRAEETGYTYQVMSGYVGFGEVNPTTGTYPTLTGTTVIAKKTQTTTTKTIQDDDNVVAIGDIVTYVIEVNVPYINPNDTNKSFTITDEIQGADYYLTGTNAKAEVKMDGEDVKVGENSGSQLFAVDGHRFTITLDSLINEANSNATKKITVTYTAKVTAVTVNNKAQGHAGNSDYSSSTVNSFGSEVTLVKYGEMLTSGNRAVLAGAVFEVYEVNEQGKTVGNALKFTFVKASENTGVDEDGNTFATVDVDHYDYAPDSTADKATEVTTNEEGVLTIRGLDVGKYKLVEVKAPEGYSINEAGASVELVLDNNNSENGKATKVILDDTSLIDTTLNSLPSTGGIGTTIFTIGGVAIMVVAAGLFFVSRRKSAK